MRSCEDDSDHAWLVKFLKETVQVEFGTKFDDLFKQLFQTAYHDHSCIPPPQELWRRMICASMFCDFVDPKNAARPYTEVQNMEKLQLVMENYLEEYNNISKKPMNLVLFRYMNNQ